MAVAARLRLRQSQHSCHSLSSAPVVQPPLKGNEGIAQAAVVGAVRAATGFAEDRRIGVRLTAI